MQNRINVEQTFKKSVLDVDAGGCRHVEILRILQHVDVDHFIGLSFPYAQPDEVGVPEGVVFGQPDEVAELGAIANDNPVSTIRRSSRKRERMMKELVSLNEDNAGKSERDRMTIWRKLQKYISRNDDIANEYVYMLLFPIH